MKKPKLKPLPCVFCKAKRENALIGVGGFTDNSTKFVVCLKCSTYGPKASSVQEAIKLWNTRSPVKK